MGAWSFLLAFALACTGCSSAPNLHPAADGTRIDSPVEAVIAAPELGGLALPTPAELAARDAQAVLEEKNGGAFWPGYSRNTNPAGTTLTFNSSWGTERLAENLSYALYIFNTGGSVPNAVYFTWQSEPAYYWIGLANFDFDCWNWVPAGESMVIIPTPADEYVNASHMLYAYIVVLSAGDYILESLSLESADSAAMENLFFLHHSTGQGFINAGMRDYIGNYNAANSTNFEFWDHCYTYPAEPTWHGGLVNPDGTSAGTDYGDPTDATDPWDLMMIWTSEEADYTATRNLILNNHEVIGFKSCFPASNIPSADELQYYKDYYLAMRDVFDTRPDRLFIVMSTPPLRMSETTIDNANRARQFADWISSAEYLAGHPNVACFDLFDVLAIDFGGQMNTLHPDYCKPDEGDSHPNDLANSTVAPLLAQFFIDSAEAYSP